MAITVEYLTGLGLEKDVAEKIFAERGKEITAEKEKYSKLNEELKTKNADFDNINKELTELKDKKASAEEWEQKYSDLVKENEEKEKNAKAEKEKAEKLENLKNRYSQASLDADGKERQWTHEAIKNDYFNKFIEAVGNKENEGKADKDIFLELTKDDKTAFNGVHIENLEGGKNIDDNITDDMVDKIMGLK